MIRASQKKLDRTLRLQRYRSDLRIILAISLAVALLTASTVVSSEAWLRLPVLWLADTADVHPGFPLVDPDSIPGVGEELPLREAPAESAAQSPAASSIDLVRHVTAEDYTESWRQAGGDVGHLGETLRSYQVEVGPAGRLVGRLSTIGPQTADRHPLAKVRVWLSHRGRITTTGLTDDSGVFNVSGLATGTYSFFASDDDTLLAFALHVRQVETVDDEPIGIPLNSSAVSGTDVSAVLSRLAGAESDRAPQIREVEPEEDQIPEPVRPLKQVGAFATPLVTHPVQLQDDGRLIGRVRRLHPESGRHLRPQPTRVTLIRDGEAVATATTDDRGWFAMNNVEPGAYALVAMTLDESERVAIDEDRQEVAVTGERPQPRGFAAFAVTVIAADDDGERPPSPSDEFLVAGEALELEFALIELSNWLAFTRDRGSSLESTRRTASTGNARLGGETQGLAPQASPSTPPVLNNNPPAGGGGGFPISFLPPEDNGTQLISPPIP